MGLPVINTCTTGTGTGTGTGAGAEILCWACWVMATEDGEGGFNVLLVDDDDDDDGSDEDEDSMRCVMLLVVKAVDSMRWDRHCGVRGRWERHNTK